MASRAAGTYWRGLARRLVYMAGGGLCKSGQDARTRIYNVRAARALNTLVQRAKAAAAHERSSFGWRGANRPERRHVLAARHHHAWPRPLSSQMSKLVDQLSFCWPCNWMLATNLQAC